MSTLEGALLGKKTLGKQHASNTKSSRQSFTKSIPSVLEKQIPCPFHFHPPKNARGRDLAQDLKSTQGADLLCLLLRG